MSELMRAVIDTLIPKGSAWGVAPDEDWDKLNDGMAENWEIIRIFLSNLENTRNPDFTPFLADLEREFGVLTNTNLTEAQRRTFLKPVIYNRDSNGSIDNLQQALDDAGFNVQVHLNDPAINPNILIGTAVLFGVTEAVFGAQSSIFGGSTNFELLVNGDLFRQFLGYTTIFGNIEAVFGSQSLQFGSHSGVERELVTYSVPSDSGDWPLVFFIGGDATRDGSGFLTDIQTGSVPIEQKSQFRTLILKYKPIHSWAGLIIDYV